MKIKQRQIFEDGSNTKPITQQASDGPANLSLRTYTKVMQVPKSSIKLLMGILLMVFGTSYQHLLAQEFTISGKIIIEESAEVSQGVVAIKGTSIYTKTDSQGNFQLDKVPAGTHTLVAFCLGKAIQERTLSVDRNIVLEFELQDLDQTLDLVTIQAAREAEFGLTRLQAVEDFGIYEGRKSEVIILKNLVANLSTNNARQVYARITGLNIWESDQAGLQLGIGGRGLNPNRSSNFNVRQNGYDIAADALGYPESYYTPPVEALERIEIVRGAASLQYGTQFGGLLNFKFKTGPRDKKIALNARQSVGSWGFFNTFNSIGGTVGKLNYYTYYQYKRSDGYRPNSGFDSHNFYASLNYEFSPKFSANIELTKMHYLAQQAGGLTDRLFQENPRQSIRTRNWFKVDWNLLALNLTYNITPNTKLNMRNFALDAQRLSVGNLERINVIDFGQERTLIDGQFQNLGHETRLLHSYNLAGQHNTLLVGLRLYQGTTYARQGFGSAGNGPDFRYLNPGDLEDSDYVFPNQNTAVFAESILNINEKLSFTPGIRWERIWTFAKGYYKQYVIDAAGNIIVNNRIDERLSRSRDFILLGLGMSYKVDKSFELYANVSQNYRAINFTDLRINNPNLRVDPNIQDERGYTADIGIRGRNNNVFNYEVTLFFINYYGKIGQVLRTDTVLFNDFRFRSNIADARNIGVEAFTEVSLLELWKSRPKHWQWSLFANVAWIDARYTNTQDNAIRSRLVEMVPPVNIKIGSVLRYQSFNTTLQYSYVGAHFSDASNTRRTATAIEGLIPTYQVLDFSIVYQSKSFWQIEASCNNLLNEQYFTRRAEAYPGPGIIPADGRAFYLTLQLKM